MAYVLRYFMNYKDNASGLPVVVNIYYPDFADTALELIPADSPCTVSELNSDEKIFSAIRAKEFRIKFVTDNFIYPGINEFATNSDTDWKIDVLVDGAIWLTGFLLTDQMSEPWITDNTNHYVELVATDNLGTLKKLPLKKLDGTDFTPTSKQFLIDIVKPALNQAIENLPINIFDNLFEVGFYDRSDTIVKTFTTSMSATASTKVLIFLIPAYNVSPGDTIVITGSISNNGTFTVVSVAATYFATVTVVETVVDESNTQHVTWEITHVAPEIDSYQQCMVDMRTFTVNYDTFEDAYTVLTKILESRNSILFQHLGEWYIIRVSELFRVDAINGTRYDIDDSMTAISNASWLANLNQAGDIIPVDQFMVKSFSNPVLFNRVDYKYTNFDELFCNELWKRGGIIVNTSTLKEYNVDCWNHYQGAIISTTPSTVLFRRRDVIVADTEVVTESYIYLEYETAGSNESFVISEPAQVSKDDKLNVSFSRRLKNGYTGSGTEILGRVLLYADDGTYYTLDDDGIWYLSNVSFTVNAKFLVSIFSAGDNRDQWREKVVDCDFIPKSGQIRIMLYEGSTSAFTGQETHFRDLKVTYKSYLEGKTFVNVEGDYHQLTLGTNLKDSATYETFLSDSPKYLFKGALFLADGLTLTTLWYEMSAPLIEYPIKRWKAIDYYRMSGRNMLKVDGNFKGWNPDEPIIPLQKITITNGDLSKRFMPLSINDLNTASGMFRSLMIEVYGTTGVPLFTLSGEFIDPTIFKFTTKTFRQHYFVVGESYDITGTLLNNITVTVTSISKVVLFRSVEWTIYFSSGITDEAVSAASFENPVVTEIALPSATHKFDYIFKAK